MEVDDMVHALEEIQRLLKSDGCLIEIHPVRVAPLIKLYRGGDLLFAESDPGYDYDADIRHAEEALEKICQRRLFRSAGSTEFDLVTYASSVAELQVYWAMYGAYDETPKDDALIVRQTEIYTRADMVMRTARGEVDVAYHEKA